MDWLLLALMAVFILLGLTGVFTAQESISHRIGTRQVIYVTVGICVMLLLCFSNYRKFAFFSWALYVGTIIMLMAVGFAGELINGTQGTIYIGSYSINATSAAPYLLLISLAGIWTADQTPSTRGSYLNDLSRRLWINFGVFLLPCALILSTHSLPDFVLFTCGCIVMLILLKKQRILLFSYFSVLMLGIIIPILGSQLLRERIAALTKPNHDPEGLNYMVLQSKKAIQSAGWWGHGYGSHPITLPELHSHMMFPFFIYCFGWAAGISIFMAVILFIVRIINLSLKVRDSYGKAIVSGLLTVLAIQYLWSMLMSLGWAPMGGFSLPFISYIGNLVILQFAAIGIMLSVYRQKDLSLSHHSNA